MASYVSRSNEVRKEEESTGISAPERGGAVLVSAWFCTHSWLLGGVVYTRTCSPATHTLTTGWGEQYTLYNKILGAQFPPTNLGTICK